MSRYIGFAMVRRCGVCMSEFVACKRIACLATCQSTVPESFQALEGPRKIERRGHDFISTRKAELKNRIHASQKRKSDPSEGRRCSNIVLPGDRGRFAASTWQSCKTTGSRHGMTFETVGNHHQSHRTSITVMYSIDEGKMAKY